MKCYYPRCRFEGTQSAIDEHLANIGTDPDHDAPRTNTQRRIRRLTRAYIAAMASGETYRCDAIRRAIWRLQDMRRNEIRKEIRP